MKKIIMSYLLVKELYLIAQVLMEKTKVLLPNFPLLQLYNNRMSRNMDLLQSSFNTSKASAYTEQLKEMDNLRDDIFRGLVEYIKSFLKFGSDEQKSAAEHLLGIVNNFGLEIVRQSYEVESVSMQKFLSKLDETKSQEALAKLTALPIYQNLQSAENNFEALLNQRNSEETNEVLYPETREAFKDLFADVENMLHTLDLLQNEAPGNELQTACNAINEYISDVMATARARKTRKAHSKVEESDSMNATNI